MSKAVALHRLQHAVTWAQGKPAELADAVRRRISRAISDAELELDADPEEPDVELLAAIDAARLQLPAEV